ncbi:long-chain fatty acid--CoA ligase, partial [Escherichia coli]|nr:long-chain fatty acid--CoA ligase [Escherichia coli]
AALRERSNRLSGALAALGLEAGDRVGTLAWNTIHHFEIYYAAMGVGMVCHTLNPRLTAAHLAAMIDEAGNRVLAVAADLLPLAGDVIARCPTIEHVVILDRPDAGVGALGSHRARIWEHEALLAAHGMPVPWGEFDE